MDPYELKEDIERMHEYLRQQKKLITSSKEEAEKYLNRLGVMHLFVPIKTRKSKKANTPKSKKAGKRKSAGK